MESSKSSSNSITLVCQTGVGEDLLQRARAEGVRPPEDQCVRQPGRPSPRRDDGERDPRLLSDVSRGRIG